MRRPTPGSTSPSVSISAPGSSLPILVTRASRAAWPFQVAFFRVHRAVLRASRGRIGRSLVGRPVLQLETTGRRTGRPRSVPLIYVRDGEHLVVAGSHGGRHDDPAWVANLRADPSAVVDLDGRRLAVRARPAEPGERARLWAALDGVNGGQYSRYQAITRREIPVIVLAPVGAGDPGGSPKGPMVGRIVVVTGATSGIGLATAEALARLGASLVLVGRDAAATHGAAARISRATGNRDVRALVADLASRRDVRALGDELARLPRIDVLAHVAGVWHLRRRETPDGIEETLAVNHLAPFALTARLMPLLASTPGARVIVVGSHAAYGGQVRWSDPTWARGRYGPYGAYAQAKVLNVLFARELARRVALSGAAGPLVVATAPGTVRTKLLAEAGPLLHGFMCLFAASPARGAEGLVWLASTPDLPPDAAGGWFWGRRRIPGPPAAREPDAGPRAWAMTERLAGEIAPASQHPGPGRAG